MPKPCRGDFLECLNPDCRRLFRKDRQAQTEGCCSRSCARRYEWVKRQPTKEQLIAAVLRAVEIELRRVLK